MGSLLQGRHTCLLPLGELTRTRQTLISLEGFWLCADVVYYSVRQVTYCFLIKSGGNKAGLPSEDLR